MPERASAVTPPMPVMKRHFSHTTRVMAVETSSAISPQVDLIPVEKAIVDGTNALATFRGNMERYYQDNRTYQSTGAFVSPCLLPVAQRTVGNFVVSCSVGPAPDTYTLQAVGGGPAAGFTFTVDQLDTRQTTAAPAGWNVCNIRWILKRGQACV